jgi:hypothetical protein
LQPGRGLVWPRGRKPKAKQQLAKTKQKLYSSSSSPVELVEQNGYDLNQQVNMILGMRLLSHFQNGQVNQAGKRQQFRQIIPISE